jgi:hypothetical protein
MEWFEALLVRLDSAVSPSQAIAWRICASYCIALFPSDVLAKSILTLPFIMILSLCCLGIPAFVIMDVPYQAAKTLFFVFAALLFAFESCAEFFSILFDDPILGMLLFMTFWCKSSAVSVSRVKQEWLAS